MSILTNINILSDASHSKLIACLLYSVQITDHCMSLPS